MTHSTPRRDRAPALLQLLRSNAPLHDTAGAQSRARHVADLEKLIARAPEEQRRRSRRARTGASAALAIAAGLALWVALPAATHSPDKAHLEAPPTSPPSPSPTAYASEPGSVLKLPRGAVAELVRSSDLRSEAGALRLFEGEVRFRVAPQPAGRPFSVATPNAKVTVLGTVFTVTVVPTAGSVRSCVHVKEGRVRVEARDQSATLGAGERWTSDGQACGAIAPHDGGAPPPRSNATSIERPGPAARAPAPPPDKPPPPSSLAEQNRLFAEILRARRAGKTEEAERQLNELLRRYPDTPLRPLLTKERRRIEREKSH